MSRIVRFFPTCGKPSFVNFGLDKSFTLWYDASAIHKLDKAVGISTELGRERQIAGAAPLLAKNGGGNRSARYLNRPFKRRVVWERGARGKGNRSQQQICQAPLVKITIGAMRS